MTDVGCRMWLSGMANEGNLVYGDDFMRDLLSRVRTIAMVGASPKWNRPSYFAMSYMQQKGYRVIPVNPMAAASGETILGETVYASLEDIPDIESVDMVDIFRSSEAAGSITDDALALGIDTIWMQLGVRNDEAARRAEEAGATVVMDRCPKIEYSRLHSELGWHGFDSGVISSKRRSLGGKPSRERNDKEKSKTERPSFSGFDTKAIHAGASPEPVTGARSTPIFQTTAYVFDDVEHAASLFNLSTFGNIYSRLSNPTTAVLEERLASLEGGRGTTCTASGHSAQLLALFALMSPGDTLIASNQLYGPYPTHMHATSHVLRRNE